MRQLAHPERGSDQVFDMAVASVSERCNLEGSADVPTESATRAAGAAQRQVVRNSPLADPRRPATSALRVLVADDSVVIRTIVDMMLQSMGMEVIQAENGREAIEHVETSGVDLVLMDVEMPVCDGVEATKEIRAREARLGIAAVPILAITGSCGPAERQRIMASGMNDVLSKPFTREQLELRLHIWQEGIR